MTRISSGIHLSTFQAYSLSNRTQPKHLSTGDRQTHVQQKTATQSCNWWADFSMLVLSPQEARNAKSRTLEPLFTWWTGWMTSSEHASLHSANGLLQIALNHPLQKDLGSPTSSLFGEPWAAYHHSIHMFGGEPSTGTLSMRSSSVGHSKVLELSSSSSFFLWRTKNNRWNPFWRKSYPEVKWEIKWLSALSPRTKWLQEANSPQLHMLQVAQSVGLPIFF